MSLCYLELDPLGHFIYVNGGHCPPMIVNFDTGQHRRLPSTGPVLGLAQSFEKRYRRAFDRLEPGEVLVAFTDGVVDAPDHEDVSFGEARLVSAVLDAPHRGAQALAENLLDGIPVGSRKPELDDQTLVILRRLPE